MIRKTERLDSLDIAKFVMSLMIVAIHTELTVCLGAFDFVYPWVRMAVPLFFMISGWLFFEKVCDCERTEKRRCLLRFVRRVALLYGFWFVATLPMTLVLHFQEWFCRGWTHGFWSMATSFFLGSTFPASWFLMALVIDVVLVLVLISVIGRFGTVVCCGIVYVGVCIRSSHPGLISNSDMLSAFFSLYDAYLPPIYCSFPAGLLWVSLGAVCAGHAQIIRNARLSWMCGALVASSVFLYDEWLLTRGDALSCDAYFSLAPVCLLVFLLSLRMKADVPGIRRLQSFSIVLYCSHGTVMRLLPTKMLLPYLGGLTPIFKFCWTVSVCFILFLLLRRFESQPKMRWLSYAH